MAVASQFLAVVCELLPSTARLGRQALSLSGYFSGNPVWGGNPIKGMELRELRVGITHQRICSGGVSFPRTLPSTKNFSNFAWCNVTSLSSLWVHHVGAASSQGTGSAADARGVLPRRAAPCHGAAPPCPASPGPLSRWVGAQGSGSGLHQGRGLPGRGRDGTAGSKRAPSGWAQPHRCGLTPEQPVPEIPRQRCPPGGLSCWRPGSSPPRWESPRPAPPAPCPSRRYRLPSLDGAGDSARRGCAAPGPPAPAPWLPPCTPAPTGIPRHPSTPRTAPSTSAIHHHLPTPCFPYTPLHVAHPPVHPPCHGITGWFGLKGP